MNDSDKYRDGFRERFPEAQDRTEAPYKAADETSMLQPYMAARNSHPAPQLQSEVHIIWPSTKQSANIWCTIIIY